MRPALQWTGIVVAAVIGVAALFVALFDWNRLRGPLERMASERSGRPVRILGELSVRAGSLTPSISIDGLTIGNPQWVREDVREATDDLGAEVFDLTVRGQPKKLRLLRVRSPIEIQGPLRKPDVGVKSGNLAGQTGIAAALGTLVAPLAAVIAFVDPGLARDADCGALLAEALLAEARNNAAPVKEGSIKSAQREAGTLR